MYKIKIVSSSQGSGGVRLIDEVWNKLLLLDDGHLKDYSDRVELYSTDGLLSVAWKNFKSRFVFTPNQYYLNYSEHGLGDNLLVRSNINPMEFILHSTGIYDFTGRSFFIKINIDKQIEDIDIDTRYFFAIRFKPDEIDLVRYFFTELFEVKPKKSQVFIDNVDEDHMYVVLRVNFARELGFYLHKMFHSGGLQNDTRWHRLYYGLKDPYLVQYNGDGHFTKYIP